MDQRKYPRKKLRLKVWVQGEAAVGGAIILNLSRRGCALQCDRALQVGDFLAVDIHPPHEKLPVKIEVAVIRWARGKHFGLEFLRVHAAEEELLRELVKSSEWLHNLKRAVAGSSRRSGS